MLPPKTVTDISDYIRLVEENKLDKSDSSKERLEQAQQKIGLNFLAEILK
jgi:hypothetical protein